METKCREADVFDQKASDIDHLLDMEHIAQCSHCHRLMEGHQKLHYAFQSTPRNTPSIHFDRKLSRRLYEEQMHKHQLRSRMAVMRFYWFLAAVVSLFILWLVPWPAQVFSAPVVASFSVFVGLVAIVPTLIYHSLSKGRSLT